jgi:hypothetical protein
MANPYRRPPASGALLEMLARDDGTDPAPTFGPAGELAQPTKAPPPAPPPIKIPPPDWEQEARERRVRERNDDQLEPPSARQASPAPKTPRLARVRRWQQEDA